MKKLALILMMVFAWLSLSSQSTEGIISRKVIYKPGDYNSQFYRIPAITTAKDGSLVVMTDKRKFNEIDIPEDIDVVCNISTDNGKTWSEPYTVALGKGVGAGYGDAAISQTTEDNGLIALVVGGAGLWASTPENSNRTYQTFSRDNGRTWSELEDITDMIFGAGCNDSVRSKWLACFVASGNGLLTKNGRLIFVACIRENDKPYLNNYAIYSDDNGKTWKISTRASIGGDEAKVVELHDGSILMSIRHGGRRWYNISHDGGETWSETTSEWTDLVGPACNGDIIRYSSKEHGGEHDILLHSLPAGISRNNVAVYVSYDEGKTWPISKIIVPYYSAYSSLCVLPDNTIGMYVEERTDDSKGYELVFYNFTLQWLLGL